MLCRVLLLLAALPATGLAGPLPPPPEGWEPLVFEKVERETRYERVPESGALRAESECSASALVRSLEPDALARAPRLRWRWRVERGLPDHDERTKAGDDFAARVYVLFAFDADRASLWERTLQRLGRSLFGRELPGRAINYVWSSREPEGSTWTSPYVSSSRLVSMGRGPFEGWRTEEVEPRADYRRLFDAEPPPAMAVALMTDSDDTCGRAVAWYADFELTAP